MGAYPGNKPEEQDGEPDWENVAKDALIDRVLLQQEARESDQEVSDEEIDEAMRKLMADQGGEEAFRERYCKTDEDEARVRGQVALDLRVEKLIDGICEAVEDPADSEILKCYQTHLDEYVTPEQVRASHVVKRPASQDDRETFSKMVEIRNQLLDGADFAELADEHSDCREEPGGDLGFFPRGQMVEAFETVLFSMNKGEISPVFMTQFGYHIATITDRKESRQQLLQEVRDQIAGSLRDGKEGELIDDHVGKLRKNATIVEIEEKTAEDESLAGTSD